jgi:hypothetical protein
MLSLILLLVFPALETIAAAVLLFKRHPAYAPAVLPLAFLLGVMSREWAFLAGLDHEGYPKLAGALTYALWHAAWVAVGIHLPKASIERGRWRGLAFGVIVFLFASGSTFTDRFESFWAGLLGACSVVSLIGALFTLRTDDLRARRLGWGLWSLFPAACGVVAALRVLQVL